MLIDIYVEIKKDVHVNVHIFRRLWFERTSSAGFVEIGRFALLRATPTFAVCTQ